MTLLQPFSALVLWLSLLMVTRCVVLVPDKPEEKVYPCPVIQCSAPAVNGLPGRDGRDLRTFSNSVFLILLIIPLVLFHASFILSFSNDLHRQVTALERKVQVLEAELNRYKKVLVKKIFVSTEKEDTFDNGKSFCAKAGSASASSRKEAENTTLKNLITPSMQAYMGISAEQTKSTFMYLNEEAVTYRNRNAGEPNNLKKEDCAVMQDSGKWNDIDC
uniref:C-type lectin domain-containing protein n=1 Tax=Accipiter nisus TaxID=211598 RepID=A0A8B9MJ08_9AVES